MPCTRNPLQRGRIPSLGQLFGLAWLSGVEDWVLRGRDLRTPPGPEGSNGKQIPLGAAGLPGLSELARVHCGSCHQQRVHDHFTRWDTGPPFCLSRILGYARDAVGRGSWRGRGGAHGRRPSCRVGRASHLAGKDRTGGDQAGSYGARARKPGPCGRHGGFCRAPHSQWRLFAERSGSL